MPFNPAQLSTLDEARVLAAALNLRGIGGGVLPETADNDTSGIYRALPWVNPNGDMPEPSIGDSLAYLFRFKNGAAGINVGLLRDKFSRYPFSPEYVFSTIKAEVDSLSTVAN